ncbi:MAG: DUF502 domain-containing protein [Puniceicoccales bacterium]|jgi:uncharacterized membrane protein|nr:DUF502 domain-containing protein [Puniceicoccales bacterium]
MRALRNAFITGLLLCLPLAITVYVLWLILGLAAKPLNGHVLTFIEWVVPRAGLDPALAASSWVEPVAYVLSAILLVTVITLLGWFSKNLIGGILISRVENVIESLPGVKSIYVSIKQIVAMFGAKNKENFKQVALVQFPHAGAWTVAFVTNRDPSEISAILGYPAVHVFVPTTPNPTGGYFMVFRESDIRPLSMSITEGMKLVVSCGSLLPENSAAFAGETATAGDGADVAAGTPLRQ